MSTDAVTVLAREIIAGDFDQEAVAARLMALAARGEGPEDILSMATAFREAAIAVPTQQAVVADLCGTGGAPFRTFNVSTAASFIVSSLGVPVAKHGNRSNRGPCGSADVMEALGARITLGPEEAGHLLDRLGFVFLFAPAFHPAMRNAAAVRRQIPTRTVFNLLGPLLNPVAARHRQLLGVYDPQLLQIVPPTLEALGTERALVVHGAPGMDEVSLLGPTRVAELVNGRIERYVLYPADFGFTPPDRKDLCDLPPALAAQAVREVLSGVPGPRRNMVVLNAACALYAFGRASDIAVGVGLAERAIDSGAARRRLEAYVAASRTLGAHHG
jgi:anthranilate phosphoribosyltransferase